MSVSVHERGRDMDLVDTHCHIDVGSFSLDCSRVIERSRELGVHTMVVPAVTRRGWPHLLDVCRRYKGCYPALGLHPMYLDYHDKSDLEALAVEAERSEVVAIGEIGLDYWQDAPDRQSQQQLFEEQLRIAADADLPVLLHARKAHDQVLAALRRLKFHRGGIVHAFSGSIQQAEAYVKLGFKIGIGGTVTFERANRVRTVARELPLETLVLETDAPDIPPAGHRHERNSPEFLPEILEALAALRNESKEEIAGQTTANARLLLKL